MDELVTWQKQSDLVLVKVRIQIWPISGIQNINFTLAEVCALLSAILATFATEGEGGYVFTPLCLSVCRISQKFEDGSG